MARTEALSLARIAAWGNVARALRRAALGKRGRPAVRSAQAQPERTIARVAAALREGCLPVGRYRSFTIHDPKRREIHAPHFLDRVAHHALVSDLEPVFERVLLPSVFACRPGKGAHAAVYHAQRQAMRFEWVMHLDIAHYFPAIDHEVLRRQLRRRFRGDGLRLVDAVIDAHGSDVGRGLPIGALTSQHFANQYLDGADRWSLSQPGVRAHCRYMDDFLLWADDKAVLLQLRESLARYLHDQLRLAIKPPLIQRTEREVLFCGVRVKPYSLRPSARRRRRYRRAVAAWEERWLRGEIDARCLQRAYDAVHAILLPADDPAWRKRIHAGNRIDA